MMNSNLPQMWQVRPSFRTTYQQPPPAQQQYILFQLMGCPANTMPMFWHRNGNSTILLSQIYEPQFSTSPASHPMDQYHLENYRAPSTGPSRNREQRRGRRKTESPCSNQFRHASLARIRRDPCTGITQPRKMGAANGTGTGWAGRSPSGAQSSMPDRRCQPKQRNRYDEDRLGSSLRNHRGRFRDDDPSQYEIHIIEGSGGSNSHQHQVAGPVGIAPLAPPLPPLVASTMAPTTAGSLPVTPTTIIPKVSDMTATSTIAEKQVVEEEEEGFDTISLGSEPDEYQY